MKNATEHAETQHLDNLVVFTSTFYNNDEQGQIRSKLALDLVRNAQDLGIKLVISDGSPVLLNETISQFEKDAHDIIWNNDNILIIRTTKRLEWWKSTMADERKQALEQWMDAYTDASHFLWIEPEKSDLIKQESLGAIMKSANETGADFVIPTRAKLAYVLNKNTNKKYPDHAQGGTNTLTNLQARTEVRANERLSIEAYRKKIGEEERKALYEKFKEQIPEKKHENSYTFGEYLIEKELVHVHDSFFGPVLLKKWTGTTKYLESDHPTRGVNVLTPIEGKNEWLKVSDARVDYRYDPNQTNFENGETDSDGKPIAAEQWKKIADEFKKKRIKQFMNLIYQDQKPEDVFPTYYNNLIYSQERFNSMNPAEQKEAYKNLFKIVKDTYKDVNKNYQSQGKFKDDRSGKIDDAFNKDDTLLIRCTTRLKSLWALLNRYKNIDDPQEIKTNYPSLKERYVFLKPDIYKGSIFYERITPTSTREVPTNPGVESFEQKLIHRDTKRN